MLHIHIGTFINKFIPTALNNYIEKNKNIFKTLIIGGRKRRNSKKIIKRRQNSRKLKTMKKQRKVTIKRLKRNGRKTKGR